MAHSFPTRGRLIQVERPTGTIVAGVRTKSISINGEPIDITSDDDLGWRKLLDQPGELTIEISVSGVIKAESLIQEGISITDRVQAMSFEWPGASSVGSLVGDFFLSAFSLTGEYQGAAVFEATFVSSGAITFTAAI